MKQEKRKRIWIVFSVLLVLILLFFWYENHHLTVSKYVYRDERIRDGLTGFRIVQISDLHNATFGFDNKKLIDQIGQQSPDILVITGDIVDSNHTNIKTAITFARKCVEVCPTYYVTGNHEYWLSEKELQDLYQGLDEAGVVILNNSTVTVNKGSETFTLLGLDDKHLSDMTLRNLMEEVPAEQVTVVLAHEPQYIQEYSRGGADLVLSGHAHGGQFILPFLGPVVAPDQGFFPQYTEGEHLSGKTHMIISRGLGNSVIPVRIFNAPEIVVVELQGTER